MSGYLRPPIPRRVFTGPDGEEFEYGGRWFGTDGPPDWAYSHDSHPERFAPLHDVADALVAHLEAAFDVRPDANPSLVVPGRRPPPAHSRARRLVPASQDAAPLTFVWTDYPGVVLHAGALADLPYPVCGCDACDDDPARLAEDLEETVFAVVEGRLREWVEPLRRVVGHEVVGRGGSWGPDEQVPRAHLRAVARRLDRLPSGRWRPWPARG